MKKINYAFSFTALIFALCCSRGGGGGSYTVKILTAKAGLIQLGDSLIFNVSPAETQQTSISSFSFSLVPKLYACEEPPYFYDYVNEIDSLQVYTVHPFNEQYPAGSNISAIVGKHKDYYDYWSKEDSARYLSDEYNILDEKIFGKYYSSSFYLKERPTHSCLQLKITGRITDVEDNFEIKTNTITIE